MNRVLIAPFPAHAGREQRINNPPFPDHSLTEQNATMLEWGLHTLGHEAMPERGKNTNELLAVSPNSSKLFLIHKLKTS